VTTTLSAAVAPTPTEPAVDPDVDLVAEALAGRVDPDSLSGRNLREYRSAVRVAQREANDERRLAEAVAAGCDACEHSVRHGWWGPLPDGCRTHCRSCHRSWTSLAECHCPACCEHFVSGRAAEAHRRGGECEDPATATRSDGRPKFVARVRRGRDVWAIAFYGQRPAHWGRRADAPADT
jgi:hypothetical protein